MIGIWLWVELLRISLVVLGLVGFSCGFMGWLLRANLGFGWFSVANLGFGGFAAFCFVRLVWYEFCGFWMCLFVCAGG